MSTHHTLLEPEESFVERVCHGEDVHWKLPPGNMRSNAQLWIHGELVRRQVRTVVLDLKRGAQNGLPAALEHAVCRSSLPISSAPIRGLRTFFEALHKTNQPLVVLIINVDECYWCEFWNNLFSGLRGLVEAQRVSETRNITIGSFGELDTARFQRTIYGSCYHAAMI